MPKLKGMTPMQQAMEIGRIANEIQVSQGNKQAKPKPKISQAPDPIEVSTGSSSFVDEDAERRKRDKTFSIE